MVRKIIILLFLFLLMNILLTFKSEKDIPAFNYIDSRENDYDIYVLSFPNLNTFNIINYFNDFDIQILGIYPKINPLYENKVKNKLKYYSFEKGDLSNNVNRFTEYYLSILSNLGLNGEKEKIYLNGIKILKVKVYASNQELSRFMKRYSNMTYR